MRAARTKFQFHFSRFHVGNKIDKGLAGYGLKGLRTDGHCRFVADNSNFLESMEIVFSRQRLQRSTEWTIPANNVLLISGGFCRRIQSGRVSIQRTRRPSADLVTSCRLSMAGRYGKQLTRPIITALSSGSISMDRHSGHSRDNDID